MRNRLSGLLCLCIGCLVPFATFGAVWSVERDVLVRREAGRYIEARLPDDVRSLSPRADGGAWLGGAGGVWSLAQDGQVQLHVDVALHGFGNVVASAADAYDGTAWIATDAGLLLHFGADGTLAHGTTLPAPATALAVDLEQGIWTIAHGELLHFARDGRWLATRLLDLGADERVTALGTDAFHGRVWFATSTGLYQAAYDPRCGPCMRFAAKRPHSHSISAAAACLQSSTAHWWHSTAPNDERWTR